MKVIFLIGVLLIVFRYVYIFYDGYTTFNNYQGSWGKPNKVRMKFAQWKDLYFVNPERYNLEKRDCNLIFKGNLDGWGERENIQIVFTFFDYIKFLLFVNKIRNQETHILKTKEDIKENESLKKILEVTQSDIEKLRKESEKEIAKATNAIKESTTCGKVSPDFINALDHELKELKNLN